MRRYIVVLGIIVLSLVVFVGAGRKKGGQEVEALDFYNVMDYGATGDGSTDDTAAIQAAIDAAEAATPSSGTIYFPNPAVDYQVTTITVSAFGMRLLGETALSTKIIGTGLTGSVIVMNHNQGRIEQLNIGATSARTAVSATTYSDSTPVAGNHGILYTPTLDTITQSRNYVLNVIVRGQPDDGLVMEQPEIATIDTVISKENGRFGIHLNGQTLNQGINNIIRNSRTGPTNVNTGIFIRTIFQSTITGCQVQSSTAANPQIEIRGGQDVRLINAIIVPGADVAGVGIQIRGEKHSIIGGFINRMDTPIALNTATSTTISFPYITNLTGSHADQVVSVSSDSHDNILMLGSLGRYTFVDALTAINAASTGNVIFDGGWRRIVRAEQAVAGGGTIVDNACGSVKLITTDDGGAETTSTTNTFTAPAESNNGCIMYVCNNGGADNITLDDNALFSAGADVVLTPEDCVTVGSNGSIWYQLSALEAN